MATRVPVSRRFGAGTRLVMAALLLLVGQTLTADPAEHGLSLVPLEPAGPDSPLGGQTLPELPVQLLIDDGAADSAFGFGGGTARQFLWFNRFENPGSFLLEEIWVLFPNGMDVPAGGDIELVIYADDDEDPSNGADLIGVYQETIQAVDGTTFSVYSLPSPLEIDTTGDVLIGVINRYFMTGVDPPPTFPAAVDTTSSEGRSHFALWAGDAENPPELATATAIEVLDGVSAGNFLIRGFGSQGPVVDVPSLDVVGFVLLASLLGLAGLVAVRRLAV